MAVNYPNASKAARSQVVVDRVAGKTVAAATGTATAPSLVIGTAALSGATGVLVTIPMAADWAANSSAGVISLNNLPLAANASAAATSGAPAAKAEIRTNAGAVEISGLTVGTSGSDIIIDNTQFNSGQQVRVTAGSITPAA